MPSRPMERFLTRRSISIVTGSLAFIVMYWYIRRQRRLKCENINRKVSAKSCSQKNFDDLKESKSSSKKNVALVVKLNDDVMSGDNAGDAGMDDNQFERQLNDDLLIAELDNDVIHANDIPVLEVSTNSLSESEKTPVDSLPCANKVLVSFDFIHLKQIAFLLILERINVYIIEPNYVKQFCIALFFCISPQ